ncbi:MAG TPA: hypothetical protein VE758_03430 [Chthoniobacterales bacterium]|jgi:hypothetical protein|nr:hypothetical protein [Chthoniobacterales bacterium]
MSSRIFLAALALIFASTNTHLLAQEVVANPAEEESAPEKPEREKKVDAESKHAGRVLQDMMTAEEFRAAGLDKLTPEELKNLNAWLQGYRQTAETKAAEEATAEVTKKVAKESRARMDEIFSRIDGPFHGLTGKTIIKLEDGTVWKQANSDDRLSATMTDHPPVMVKHLVFGYKMRVVGTGEFYVNPVR